MLHKFIKYSCIVLLVSFSLTKVHANTIYKITRMLDIREAFALGSTLTEELGIKTSTGGGRSIEVRMYAKDYYTVGGRGTDLESFLYGGYTSGNHPNSFYITSWLDSFTNASCSWPIIGNFTCLLTGGPTYSLKSTDFKRRLSAVLSNQSFLGLNTATEMEVIIELELKSDYSALNDVKEIKLPGVEILYPGDFTTSIKGINYHVRKAAANSTLDIANISYATENIELFNITDNKLSADENMDYEIAIPRKLKATVLAKLPSGYKKRSKNSFPTNMVVYPTEGEGRGHYFYLVSASSSPATVLSKIKVATGFTATNEGEIFEALVDGTSYTFYLFKIETPTAERAIIEQVTTLGPFPTAKTTGLNTESPILASHNRKMLAKSSLPDDEKFMVAWHRGFWRDYPENSLQSVIEAKLFLDTSDILELDVQRTWDLNSSSVYNYVLYHDSYMFRMSSIGPNNDRDKCIDPYNKILVKKDLLSYKKKAQLIAELKKRFPGYTDAEYTNWRKGTSDYMLSQLTATKIRDRFGCLTDITIPTFEQALESAKTSNLPIIIDKGWDNIDNIYWNAILHDYEDHVFFKGGDKLSADKLTKMYGDELFRQICYTPFLFDKSAQSDKAINSSGEVIFLKNFLDKERDQGWIIPGFELQIKNKASDGTAADGFFPDGTQRLLDWSAAHKEEKWIGITQICPTAINGFDGKIVITDAPSTKKNAEAYSSRFDRRADLNFNVNYLGADYWTADRPDVVVDFLKAIGKIKK